MKSEAELYKLPTVSLVFVFLFFYLIHVLLLRMIVFRVLISFGFKCLHRFLPPLFSDLMLFNDWSDVAVMLMNP